MITTCAGKALRTASINAGSFVGVRRSNRTWLWIVNCDLTPSIKCNDANDQKTAHTSSLLLLSCPSFTVLSSFSFIIFRAWPATMGYTAIQTHLGVEDPLGVRIVLQRLLQIGFPKSEQVCKTLRYYVCCPPAKTTLFSDKIFKCNTFFWHTIQKHPELVVINANLVLTC